MVYQMAAGNRADFMGFQRLFEKLLGSRSHQPHDSIEMAANRVAGANWLLPRIDTQYFGHLFYAGFVEPRVQELQIDRLMLSIISS
ncbi:hypothetical protein AJ88_24135 [Mesorhizobium amorphae CCBAU 01583]|nr:hypothetical protein AJ88_24135 [Mesorhizobium amorphae CCBAU 01583]